MTPKLTSLPRLAYLIAIGSLVCAAFAVVSLVVFPHLVSLNRSGWSQVVPHVWIAAIKYLSLGMAGVMILRRTSMAVWMAIAAAGMAVLDLAWRLDASAYYRTIPVRLWPMLSVLWGGMLLAWIGYALYVWRLSARHFHRPDLSRAFQ